MINQKWIQDQIKLLSRNVTQSLFSTVEKLNLTIIHLYKNCFLINFLPKWISKLVYLSLIFIVSLGLTAAAIKSPTVKIPIFGFHDIIDLQNKADLPPYRPLYGMDYTKQDLEKFVEYLVQKNYWFLSSQDLFVYFINKSQPIPSKHIGQKPVMLTFDDGYEGVHKNGMPILERMEEKYGEKVRFVLFINPKTLGVNNGKDLPHLSCQNLIEGYQKDFYDIQSHGFTHKNLTKISSKELEVELYFAKLALRKCTNDLDRNKIVAAHIAYPYGAINTKVEKKLPKYHLTGFIYDDNFLKVNYLKNKFRISRITVGSRTSPYKLIRLATRASTLKKISNERRKKEEGRRKRQEG
ncbi:MAG: polysaccharide deacetylase family protein [Okeania sp. SIO2G4]|uniref:polysaccharide deacetylase family protein n=1 Tax=unclassified Okeania TaxID=2634635 RepID=UPI0013B7AED3|nr:MULTISPECIES: polysaccharide deacetylase family protein [unclassified Okeania]NEP06836.1 polysaccharide deacetylase family protein [Okeania sp. SIO4D6]NEP72517.1 polysaccharide deacetylase family protein [Okeania sp. SIO2G5]NEP93337.1 polysaccharide deacetylase family protein [Okeania sp. SIO2F5]NEQ91444.1 polysaccharide deacetylase family protein [Okeania sp. SIO2G4]